ncbi:MAG TPA: glycosyltransferase family 39 protein [Xanthobacteraceae bacterium]
MLAWVLGMHLVVWSVLPLLVCYNLQLDLIEGLALGKEWQLGYWKHPPLPWWIDDLAFRAAGDPRVVYVLGPAACVIALYAVWRLGRAVVGEQSALIAVLALEGLHFLNFTAVKFNHDVLQLPLWALTGLFVFRAIDKGRAADWIWSGVWLALAFWTKYSAVALGAPIGLFLLFDPFARRTWRTSGPYLLAGAFLLVIAPHLWWLVEHGFIPLDYAAARARVAIHWYEYLEFPLRWTASQLVFLAPTLALLAVVLLGAARSEAPRDPRAAFMRNYVTVLALGPFLLITLGAGLLGRLVVAMWGYPLWLFAPLAAVSWFGPVLAPQRARLFARACIVVLLAMPAAYVADEVLEPFLRDRPKATQFPGKLLAETLTSRWHALTGTPLIYVVQFGSSGAGEFATNNVAVYSSDRPHVVAYGKLDLSPWIDPADFDRRGGVMVWEGPVPSDLLSQFPHAELQPPLILPRQTLYPRPPLVINYAWLRPQP